MGFYRYFLAAVLLPGMVCPAALAQEFQMKDYLAASRDAMSLDAYKARLDFLDKNNFNSPWLRDMQIRIRTRDLNLSPEDYRLRLSPTNPAEISANKNYYTAQVQQLEAEYKAAFAEVLKGRYNLLLDHYFLYQQRMHSEKALIMAGELAVLMGRMAGDRRLRLGDLIDNDESHFKTEFELDAILQQMRELETLMRKEYDFAGKIDWSNGDIIHIDQVRDQMMTAPVDSGRNIYVISDEFDYKLREARLRVERSESWRNMGFLQAEYRNWTGPEFGDRLGFQLGLRIPVTNPDRADLARDRYRMADIPARINERVSSFVLQGQVLRERFNALIDRHIRVEKKIADMEQLDVRQLAQTDGQLDAGGLISYRDYLLDLKKMRLRNLREAYTIYIDYLDIQGRLVEVPTINYISPGLEEF